VFIFCKDVKESMKVIFGKKRKKSFFPVELPLAFYVKVRGKNIRRTKRKFDGKMIFFVSYSE
jgi:hypothetical protein